MSKTINFGTDTLDRARERLGLTNRNVWEGLGVSETTWMRWKRTGRVPVEAVTAVVLFLDLEQPPGMPDYAPTLGWAIRENVRESGRLIQELRLGSVLDRLTDLEQDVADLRRRLDPPPGAPGRRD